MSCLRRARRSPGIALLLAGSLLVAPALRAQGTARSELSGVVSDSAGRPIADAAVTPRKGQHRLVQALAAAADLPWSCVCVGGLGHDPEYVAHLRQLIKEHGLQDRIELAGPRSGAELDASYATADLMVLTSYAETYGMAVTEALARGIPVLATDVGGLPEAGVRDRRLLVPQRGLHGLGRQGRERGGAHEVGGPLGEHRGDIPKRREARDGRTQPRHRLSRRIVDHRTPRLLPSADQSGHRRQAVGDLPNPTHEEGGAAQRGQQRQPAPAAPQTRCRFHGASVKPSCATITRGSPLATVPGRKAAASRATSSMKASLWLGS